MNPPIHFSKIHPGGLFYLDHCPGNSYRKVDHKTAEFASHRFDNSYIGCKISMGPSSWVRLAPFSELLDAPIPPEWRSCWCGNHIYHATHEECHHCRKSASGEDLLETTNGMDLLA
jgi:hypothetical protein